MSELSRTGTYKVSRTLSLAFFLIFVLDIVARLFMNEGNVVVGTIAMWSLILFITSLVIWLSSISSRNHRIQINEKLSDQEKRHEVFMQLSKEDRRFELQAYMQDTQRAQSLAGWSYLGIVVPLVGWILVGMCFSTLKSIPIGLSEALDGRSSRIRKNASLSLMLSIIVVVIYIGVSIVTGGQQTTSSVINSQSSNSQVSNLEAQNACIANAQSEVDNNPNYQPVGGNAEAYTISQNYKIMAMRPKIANCKSQYPTN